MPVTLTLADDVAADLFKQLADAANAAPPRARSKLRVVVDPGHGGRDPGASAGGVVEKVLVLDYSLELEKQLKARGHLVKMTRTSDADLAPDKDKLQWKGVDLATRSRIANDWPADVFVSMHANAGASPVANGAWVIHDDASKRGKELALRVFERLEAIAGIPDSDAADEVYPDDSNWTGGRDLAVLGGTKMPAILVELGFLTNKDDRELLQRIETRVLVAAAIVQGIEAWAAA